MGGIKEYSKDILDRNLDLLKKYHPIVFERVLNVGQESECDLNSIDFEDRQVGLEWLPKDFQGVACLLGLGSGFIPLELVRQRKTIIRIVIFELSTSHFKTILSRIDLVDLLTDPRVILHVGGQPNIKEIIAPAYNALMNETVTFHRHKVSFATCEGYQELYRDVFDYCNQLNIAGATITKRGKAFFDNRMRNLVSMHHDMLLDSLKGAFQGIPAVLVSAGPSLKKNGHLLKEIQDKAVIFSVDSALPFLLASGIEPHFLSMLDTHDFTYEKIADCAPLVKKISLICSPIVTTKTSGIFPALNKYWYFSDHPLENWINNLLGGKEVFSGLSSVAELNFMAAKIMGCEPIVFVGQDLSYSGSDSHVDRAVLSGRHLAKGEVDDGDCLWVKGAVEPRVQTGRTFHSQKLSLEALIKNSSQLVVNATEGGVHLEGSEVDSLNNIIQTRFLKEYDLYSIIEGKKQCVPRVNDTEIRQILERTKVKIYRPYYSLFG